MKQKVQLTYKNYNTGHPWYYYLGGKILSPKQILEHTRHSGYKGYLRDDITKADHRDEPRRSNDFRDLRCTVMRHMRKDLARYRQLALGLHRYRKLNQKGLTAHGSCDDIHTNISLKHNHLANGFAHLSYIDGLLTQQGNLFDF